MTIGKPYGDKRTVKRKKVPIPPDLKSEDIGTNFRIIEKEKTPAVKEISLVDQEISKYDNRFFVRHRSRNEFWISRSTTRMCAHLSLEYNAYRHEFTRVLENETAQVISVPESQQKQVRVLLEKKSEDFEEFLVSVMLPHSLALSSSLERATQMAKVISQDEDLSLDAKFITMAHNDAMSIKSIEFFLKSVDIPQEIRNLYLEQFVMHKFGSGKSGLEKSLDQFTVQTLRSQRAAEQHLATMKSSMSQMTSLLSNMDIHVGDQNG